MSAAYSCLMIPSQTGSPAVGLPSYSFSALMKDENKELACGLQRRDPDLLDRLIEQYQFRLFRYLVYITGDRTRAEDFFQETWIRVLERGHQYDGKSRFEGWLFRIARNLVIDWQRQRKPQSLDALTDPDQGHPLQIRDEHAASALEAVISSEQEAQVQNAMGQIAAVYREVLLLRFQEELQIEEIATVLGAPASTVKSRLYRGLEALRTSLEPRIS
jgi:RNA polymerase sigma-70 factor (ECF subfamily)